MHHEDYSKPTEVTWLCRPHHWELHKERRGWLVTAEERERASVLCRVWRAKHLPRVYQKDVAALLGVLQSDIQVLEQRPEIANSVVVRKVLERLGGAE